MNNYPNARDCEHGRLRRQCPLCERDEEIADLRRELAEARDAIRRYRNVGCIADSDCVECQSRNVCEYWELYQTPAVRAAVEEGGKP